MILNDAMIEGGPESGLRRFCFLLDDGEGAPLAETVPPPEIMAGVHGDAVQPPGHGILGSHLAQMPVQLQEYILGDILGVGQIAGKAEGRDQHEPLILPHQPFERGQIAGARRGQQAGSLFGLVRKTRHCRQCQAIHPLTR